jgi:phenylacetate-CoA ligase
MISVTRPFSVDYNARLNVLVAEARRKSPFYAELYNGLPLEGKVSLNELPLIEHARYWAAYHDSERSVMTSCQSDGVVLKTGGKLICLP